MSYVEAGLRILAELESAPAAATSSHGEASPSAVSSTADAPITAMSLHAFATAGLVLVVDSRALSGRVLFVSDNVPEDQIGDEHLPVYRASELKKLALLRPSPAMLRTINDAKSFFRAEGATIEEIKNGR